MVRIALFLVAASSLIGCSLAARRTGPVADREWIRTRSLGGVTLDMKPSTLVKDLAEMGYEVRFKPSMDGHVDDIVTARSVPRRLRSGEMCASPGQRVELAIWIRAGRIVQISCLRDGPRRIENFTNRFVDTVNGIRNVEVSVAAVDHGLTSFRALHAADMCPFLRFDPYRTMDDITFCRRFKPTMGPYLYSYSLEASRFPSGIMSGIVLHGG
jgi:hypothetical protein